MGFVMKFHMVLEYFELASLKVFVTRIKDGPPTEWKVFFLVNKFGSFSIDNPITVITVTQGAEKSVTESYYCLVCK